MKSRYTLFLALLVAFGLLQLASVLAAPPSRTLKVKLNYTGAGIVGEKHRIYVMLFDANPMTAATLVDTISQPTPPTPAPGVSHILARESAAAKNATITFHQVAVSPVYALAFFDKNGTYNGHPDSSSGSPMGVHGSLPDELEPIPIDEGKTVELTLAFDDSKTTP